MPLTADQRLDDLLAQYRNRTPRGGEQLIGGKLGSPLESPVSPSVAVMMLSPPRELTRSQIKFTLKLSPLPKSLAMRLG